MPVVHIVRYFRQPLWAVEVDDSRFGGHGFYRGAAARAPSVGLDDFLTETLTQWKLATFCRILGLDLQANGFHTFYGQSFSYGPDMEMCACVYGFPSILGSVITLISLGGEREALHAS